jgi:hypothetical protein
VPVKGSPYVLTRDGRRFGGFTRPKRRLDKASGVRDWKLHDIRRTVGTWLGELGIEPFVADLVVGHATVAPGARKHYDFALYRAPKRTALEKWEAALANIINPPPKQAADKKGRGDQLRLVA